MRSVNYADFIILRHVVIVIVIVIVLLPREAMSIRLVFVMCLPTRRTVYMFTNPHNCLYVQPLVPQNHEFMVHRVYLLVG